MFLNLHGFHVKGDSPPPSQSPMRVDPFSHSNCVHTINHLIIQRSRPIVNDFGGGRFVNFFLFTAADLCYNGGENHRREAAT